MVVCMAEATKTRRKQNRLSPVVWEDIRARAESGVALNKLAEQYGCHYKTIVARSKREGWMTPGKIRTAKRLGLEVTPLSVITESPEHTRTLDKNHSKNLTPAQSAPNSLKAMKARLAASAGTDPQAFQAALAGLAEDLIAEGMRDLEPPRTVSEAAKLNDLVRKARALDKGPGADTAHIRPMRSLSRQPAIDVAPAPEPFEI